MLMDLIAQKRLMVNPSTRAGESRKLGNQGNALHKHVLIAGRRKSSASQIFLSAISVRNLAGSVGSRVREWLLWKLLPILKFCIY
jgi:hypothetical protein